MVEMYPIFCLEIHKSEINATFPDMFLKVTFKSSFSLKFFFITLFRPVILEIFCHEGENACLKKLSNDRSSTRTNGIWRTNRNFISWYLALSGSYVKTCKQPLEVV